LVNVFESYWYYQFVGTPSPPKVLAVEGVFGRHHKGYGVGVLINDLQIKMLSMWSAERGNTLLKGTVSWDVRWVLLYINWKLSMRRGNANYYILLLLKGYFTIYIKTV
jgi:hypothetical protein